MHRRTFLKTTALSPLVINAFTSNHAALSIQHNPNLSEIKKPLAINMWDFSWLLRHYKGGGFENWTKALDELVDRGYNALRIDCFPQLISADSGGKIEESFYCPKNGWGPALWGNEFSTSIEPRKSLVEFLTLCKERNIYIALSSWFLDHGTGRLNTYPTSEDFIRAWDETLSFIQDEGLLKNILYVDILNEYPLWNGYNYRWLNAEIDKQASDDITTTSGKQYDFLNEKGKRFNDAQIKVYNDFINKTINKLSDKWKPIPFLASQTNTLNVPWADLDVSNFKALDVHCWFVYNVPFSKYTNYFQDIHILKNDLEFKACNHKIKDYWKNNKVGLISWMEEQIILRKNKANELNIPYGNTEGWGTVMWMDHPDLDWNFIKESGIVCAELGNKHGYSFNCSSNFNHPHFGLWKDIQWHKEVTNIIING